MKLMQTYYDGDKDIRFGYQLANGQWTGGIFDIATCWPIPPDFFETNRCESLYDVTKYFIHHKFTLITKENSK